MAITVKTTNNLAQLIERIGSPGENVMRELGRQTLIDIEARFATQGYGEWAPLAAETVRRKENRSTILVDTGIMRRSTRISKVTNDSLEVEVPGAGEGLDPEIPIKHQEGIGVPKREIIKTTDRLLARYEPVLERWVQGNA